MKTILLNTMILAILSGFAGGLQAQTSVQKLDQVKLMKQFEGKWKAELGKDTILFSEFKAFGTGLDGFATIKTKEKVIGERRQMFGYDKKTDQFIEAEITKGSEMELWVCWFTSENLMIGVPLDNRSDPAKAVFRVEVEIKTPDSYVQTVFQNGRRIDGRNVTRR